MSEYDIVNLSINQTLTRTLLTSFSTLLAVLSIFLIGGEPLRGFSLAMLIGIVFGTYSSIYIASPIMLALGSSQTKNQNHQEVVQESLLHKSLLFFQIAAQGL